MSVAFFTADLHFGHDKVLAYEKESRPFSSIEEHDDEIVYRWNNVVQPRDRVYIVGDICINHKHLPRLRELNGIKILIPGNHDTGKIETYMQYFNKMLGVHEYKNTIVSHIPVHPSQKRRYAANIHGHTHSQRVLKGDGEIDPWYYCVSLEHHDLAPVEAAKVFSELKLPFTKEERKRAKNGDF